MRLSPAFRRLSRLSAPLAILPMLVAGNATQAQQLTQHEWAHLQYNAPEFLQGMDIGIFDGAKALIDRANLRSPFSMSATSYTGYERGVDCVQNKAVKLAWEIGPNTGPGFVLDGAISFCLGQRVRIHEEARARHLLP